MAPRPANSPEANPAYAEREPSARPARFRFPAGLAAAVERCWQKAGTAKEWGLSREQFVTALERSVAHRFGDAPAETAVERYIEVLQLRDLALACACSAGSSVAWDVFVAEFRPELYRAARAIAGDANARELADSLYADLYGLREREGQRKSLFEYFHGRSKLSTWLRAVLAQRHVDEIRRAHRTEPLEDETGAERPEVAALAVSRGPANAAHDPERAQYLAVLQATLTAVIASLDSRDRLRLAYYYADDRTLAEIGRLLNEHEATVSRKLDRTRRKIRDRVESSLRKAKRWSEEQVRLCLEHARGEWPFDLEKALRSGDAPLKPAARADAASAPD